MAIDLNAALNAAITNLNAQGLTTIQQPDGSVYVKDPATGSRAVITATGPVPAAPAAPTNQARALQVNQ